MNYDKIVPFPIASGSAYAASGGFRLAFDDVQPLPGGGTTFVRGVHLEQDMVVQTTTSTSSVPEDICRRMIDKIKHTQVGGHVFYDLGDQAGVALGKILHAMDGKRQLPPNGGQGGAITWGTSATNLRVKTWVPYYLPGSVESDDANIPLSDLNGSAIEGYWVNGASGGAFTASNSERVVSGTLRANIDLVHRNENRRAVYFSIVSETLSGLETRLLLNGRCMPWLIEIPVHSAGITESFITSANRTLATIEVDEKSPTDRMVPADLSTRWSRIHARTRDDELPNVEGDASPWLPLYCPGRRPFKLTQVPCALKKTKVRVTGTSTTPRVVHVSTILNTREKTVEHFKNFNGDDVPADFADSPEKYLSAKTHSKTDFSPTRDGAAGVQRVPIKLNAPPQTS
jgi:hypothetical protein